MYQIAKELDTANEEEEKGDGYDDDSNSNSEEDEDSNSDGDDGDDKDGSTSKKARRQAGRKRQWHMERTKGVLQKKQLLEGARVTGRTNPLLEESSRLCLEKSEQWAERLKVRDLEVVRTDGRGQCYLLLQPKSRL
jgi:hypothetical protein